MAYELTFDYIPSDGLFYKFDARCKWIAFIIISASILKLHFFGILTISLLIIGLSLTHSKSLRKGLTIPRIWVAFFSIVFAFNILGKSFSPLTFLKAILVTWKMILWITLAMLMSASTKPGDTITSINYFLRFIPLRWNHRISMMIILAMRFIPLFLKEYEKTQIACRARLGSPKTPALYFKYTLLPFLKNVFKRTDEIAIAIWSRGYREDHPLRFKPVPLRSIFALIVIIAFVIFLIEVDGKCRLDVILFQS